MLRNYSPHQYARFAGKHLFTIAPAISVQAASKFAAADLLHAHKADFDCKCK